MKAMRFKVFSFLSFWPFLDHKLKQKFLMEREQEGTTNKREQENETFTDLDAIFGLGGLLICCCRCSWSVSVALVGLSLWLLDVGSLCLLSVGLLSRVCRVEGLTG
jgi:hypothetical protein